ncbi:MAG: 4Fe-4S dicluster domain-containing protein [Candidatus Zipacnadales bacterium]
MALCVMQKEALATLIEKVLAEQKVVGPQRVPRGPHSSVFAFDEIKSPVELELNYPTTILPPKAWLLPPTEKLFEFQLGPQPTVKASLEAEPIVLFGLHPPDIAGIKCLDEVMSEGNPDPNYLARREKITIVGTEISAEEYPYASWVGNATADSGYDLFLTDIGEVLVCDVATEKGQALVDLIATRPATEEDRAAVEEVRRQTAAAAETVMGDVDIRTLPLVLTKATGSKVWEKHSEPCFRCGSCNLVCPTCYCFNVEDRTNPDLQTGARVRIWDGCMLDPFATVAGGENFRKEPKDRLLHRVSRKFHYQYTKYGHPHCTGCGRCVRTCVAKINQFDLIKDLLAEQAEGVPHGS